MLRLSDFASDIDSIALMLYIYIQNMCKLKKSQRLGSKAIRGFTIVELLIVIVVIAILAAITIVAYNGIAARANDSAVQNDLDQFAKKATLYQVDNGSYPAPSQLGALSVKVTKGSYDQAANNLYYCTDQSSSQFVFAVRSASGHGFAISSNGGIGTLNTVNSATVCAVIGQPYPGSPATPTQIGYAASGGWLSWTAN